MGPRRNAHAEGRCRRPQVRPRSAPRHECAAQGLVRLDAEGRRQARVPQGQGCLLRHRRGSLALRSDAGSGDRASRCAVPGFGRVARQRCVRRGRSRTRETRQGQARSLCQRSARHQLSRMGIGRIGQRTHRSTRHDAGGRQGPVLPLAGVRRRNRYRRLLQAVRLDRAGSARHRHRGGRVRDQGRRQQRLPQRRFDPGALSQQFARGQAGEARRGRTLRFPALQLRRAPPCQRQPPAPGDRAGQFDVCGKELQRRRHRRAGIGQGRAHRHGHPVPRCGASSALSLPLAAATSVAAGK